MGMYTGIQIKVLLKAETDPNIISILSYMVSQTDVKPTIEVDHFLFHQHRWGWMLSCQSAYFPRCEGEQPDSEYRLIQQPDGRWLLNTSSSFKHYDEEIRNFIDWLSPHVDDSMRGQEVGWYRYEELEEGEETPIIFNL